MKTALNQWLEFMTWPGILWLPWIRWKNVEREKKNAADKMRENSVYSVGVDRGVCIIVFTLCAHLKMVISKLPNICDAANWFSSFSIDFPFLVVVDVCVDTTLQLEVVLVAGGREIDFWHAMREKWKTSNWQKVWQIADAIATHYTNALSFFIRQIVNELEPKTDSIISTTHNDALTLNIVDKAQHTHTHVTRTQSSL